ncbi:hypothetical protein [Spirosoma daeguense]
MYPNLSHLYETTPLWLDSFFVVTTVLTLYLLYVAVLPISVRIARGLLIISIGWLLLLAWLAYQQFFFQFSGLPPRFMLTLGPPLLLIFSLFVIRKSSTLIQELPLPRLTFLHVVRVPVELTLYGLYVYRQIPELMTFAGRNVDILAGLTAPLVAWLVFRQKTVSLRWLFVWNVVSLLLLLNIVIHAILSAPLPFQQLAFDQPNIGVLKAPYVWLPGFIVPVVLFSHVVSLVQLSKKTT